MSRRRGPSLPLRSYGQAGLLPGGKSAAKRQDVVEPLVYQPLCHTGTLLFLSSGAVEDEVAIAGQLCAAGVHLFFRDG